MPDTSSPQADELRFRARFFRIGCIANVIVFTVLILVMVVYLIEAARNWTPSFGEPSHSAQSDEAAVRRVLNDQVAAWNRGDLDGFMDGYWKDERLTFTAGGKVELGWEATRKRYQDKYWTPGPEQQERGKLAFVSDELKIESFGPDAMLVRGQYRLTRKTGNSTGRFTLTFRKFPEGWKITSDHTSAAE